MAGKKRPRYVSRPSGVATRGYACVGLESPTDAVNVGHTLRAAMCFGARFVILADPPPGLRIDRLPTDPQRAWRHVPVLEVASVFDAVPYDCTPVAIEMVAGAINLVDFVHPERACYIFGPENGSLAPTTVERCGHTVRIPTNLSLNLGASVNVVLYDRLLKTSRNRRSPAGLGAGSGSAARVQ